MNIGNYVRNFGGLKADWSIQANTCISKFPRLSSQFVVQEGLAC